MSDDQILHDIYAGNHLFGEAMLLRMALPADWQLAPGLSRPEVAATHERHNQSWVVSGDAWYVVYDEQRRWAMELAVHLRPKAGRQKPEPQESLQIAGHSAAIQWQKKRRGLPWKRHEVTFMTVSFVCPVSERWLSLEFSGWCPVEGFREVLAVLPGLRCH